MTASPDWESLLWEARGYLGLDDETPSDHSYEHADVAPYSHLVTEVFWPAGTAAHVLAEGMSP